jgi:hypothetical protein
LDEGVADQSSEAAPQEAAADATNDPDVEADAQADAQAQAEAGAEAGACVPVDNYVPTAADIHFKAFAAVPSGEQILYGNWSTTYGVSDAVYSMAPDGSGSNKLFEAWRLWSMGVSRSIDRIAFACGDPEQDKHFCINVGDAIQHTWTYDIATQQVKLIAAGNINDECHRFGPGDKNLYVCRRYDFDAKGNNTGYTVGRINLDTLGFEFLTKETGNDMSLYGLPNADESLLYYTLIKMPANTRTLMRQALPGGTAEILRDKGSAMTLSPDGSKYVFANSDDKSALYVSNLDGTGLLKIADHNGNSVQFSPDGTRVAFLWWDGPANCSHVEVVKIDGSEASSPTRIRDCGKTNENISELAWIVRP